LPHSGNWDVAGLWLIQHGHPFTTVAERLKPESLFDKFVAYREGLGMEVLALTGAPRPPMETLKQRLTAGGVVCLVADRDLSRGGVAVNFFGEPTRMPAGPSLLAAVTGAALMPVHLYYDGAGWGQYVGAPVDLGDGDLRSKLKIGTQALADFFAERIAQYPQDWHMLQRLWLADLDRERLHAVDDQSTAGLVSPAEPTSTTIEGG
jgi:KDO2-lipid IV(A) lauroyltransferase